MRTMNLFPYGRSVGKFFLALILPLLLFMPGAHAVNAMTLEELVQRAETHKGFWFGLRAQVQIDFQRGAQGGRCVGDLLYHRMDEKILLTCQNESGRQMFIFKTDDRIFELYLPSRATVFRGNIFDLEDSPEIESHLKPLDLYRAMKPLSIPTQKAELIPWNEGVWKIRISGQKRWESYLAREVLMTSDGLVAEETFFDLEEEPTVTIFREDFRYYTPAGQAPDQNSLIYPEVVTIKSHSKETATVIRFLSVEFLMSLPVNSWIYTVPTNTRTTTFKSLGEPSITGELTQAF